LNREATHRQAFSNRSVRYIGSLTAFLVMGLGCARTTTGGQTNAQDSGATHHVAPVAVSSKADPEQSQVATSRVIDPKQVGVWVNVTPPGINLVHSYNRAGNFGVQDVVADPARPSDLYAFVCYQGVWRSADFGVSWQKVSTGKNGDSLDGGRPWTAAIDPNPRRDPKTSPTLYTVNGYGPKPGLYKSTDFGVNWVHSKLSGPGYDPAYQDVYSLDINPYDSSHILAGFHEIGGIAESRDAGATWRLMQPKNGRSLYPFFIDTGDAASTARTWVAIPQWDNGSQETYSTRNAGASWTSLGVFAHSHGGTQIFNGGKGVVYLSGTPGVHESVDAGVTKTSIRTISENGIAGTPNYLYVFSSGASSGTLDPVLARAPRSNVKDWTEVPAPAGMTNGPKRVAVTYDGSHYILVSGNWLAGIWRYVE